MKVDEIVEVSRIGPPLSVMTRQCQACGGIGWQDGYNGGLQRCIRCGGAGEVQVTKVLV